MQALAETENHRPLPESPDRLDAWMKSHTEKVHQQYQHYLQQRKEGGPRRYFSTRSHALYFLKYAAPTKLVDGAWLYGLTAWPFDPVLSHMLVTYLEELGNGESHKNHVVIYRNLLLQNGIDATEPLPDAFYRQAIVQLGLGWNASDFLPEIVGFNLAYEQLPLHLLITAYELNELGIDPHYFVLHQTIDNSDTGHALRAVQAAFDCAAGFMDCKDYWKRVQKGAALADYGKGTESIIEEFDIDQEVRWLFAKKSVAGKGAHSNYCRIEGKSVNEWLSHPEDISRLLSALEKNGWIKKNAPPSESKFWHLLTDERAEMFGVFSGYELQLIHYWIAGTHGNATPRQATPLVAESGAVPLHQRQPSFRALHRIAARENACKLPAVPSTTLSTFKETLSKLEGQEQLDFLTRAMAPCHHWTEAGQDATRMYAYLARLSPPGLR